MLKQFGSKRINHAAHNARHQRRADNLMMNDLLDARALHALVMSATR